MTIPHYKFFMLTAWRPLSEDSRQIWLFCRENDMWIGCTSLETGLRALTDNSVQEILVKKTGWGGARDTGNPALTDQVQFFSEAGQAVEYSIWQHDAYVSGDISGATSINVAFPHYKSFMGTVWRYNKMAWLFCRENDYDLGCIQVRWY